VSSRFCGAKYIACCFAAQVTFGAFFDEGSIRVTRSMRLRRVAGNSLLERVPFLKSKNMLDKIPTRARSPANGIATSLRVRADANAAITRTISRASSNASSFWSIRHGTGRADRSHRTHFQKAHP
jgi:hypothetical protein